MTLDYSDISVFSFTKKLTEGGAARFHIRRASDREQSLLAELGVMNSSCFLTNATIWVEGITDRLYLRMFFEKMCGDFENWTEDRHYSFVEYQGANLVHWNYGDGQIDDERMKAIRLCGPAFVLADGDIANKGNRVNDYKQMLRKNFYILPCKEIENLLPEELVREGVKKKFEAEGGDISQIKFAEYSSNEKEGLASIWTISSTLKASSERSPAR